MKSVHPACGFPLQRATKILAVLGIGISIGLYIVSSLELKKSMENYRRREYYTYRRLNVSIELAVKQTSGSGSGIYIGLFVLATVICLGNVLLDGFLYAAANMRALKKCRTWLALSAAAWVVGILQHIYIVVVDGYTINNIVILVYLLIDGYILWVVLAFIHEMQVRESEDVIRYRRA